MIYAGFKFFGRKIYLESTGDKDIDSALKTVFYDDYHKTRPLTISERADVRLLLARQQRLAAETGISKPEQLAGQKGLFE